MPSRGRPQCGRPSFSRSGPPLTETESGLLSTPHRHQQAHTTRKLRPLRRRADPSRGGLDSGRHFVLVLGHPKLWPIDGVHPELDRLCDTQEDIPQYSRHVPRLRSSTTCISQRLSATSHHTPNDIKLELTMNLVLHGSFIKVPEKMSRRGYHM